MKKRKNLLFVFADQWRRAAMGAYHEDPVYTPHMDAFGEEGTIFENGVSACPLCSPARASMLSGRDPLATGVFTNCKPGTDIRLRDEEICIADVLKPLGYQTGYIGKWHLDEAELNYNPSPASGAAGWDAYTPPGPRRHGFDFWYSYGACDRHLHPHYWRDTPQATKVDAWSPEHETDVALEFLRSLDRERPFCLFISWNPPHSPYAQVPEKYLRLYEGKEIPFRQNVIAHDLHCHTYETFDYTPETLREATRQYYAAVSGLDDQFGRLLEGLRACGLEEDTYVLLTADHGDLMGSHGMMAKHVWHEESIGVPLVLRGPGVAKRRCDTVVSTPDLAPTLLALLEAPIPDSMQGEDLSGMILKGEECDRAAFLCACPGRDIFLQAFREAGKNPLDYGWRALRTRTHLYVVEVGYEVTPKLQRLLYDLAADPFEQHPLTLSRPEENPLAASMEEQLCRWMRARGDGFLQHLSH